MPSVFKGQQGSQGTGVVGGRVGEHRGVNRPVKELGLYLVQDAKTLVGFWQRVISKVRF